MFFYCLDISVRYSRCFVFLGRFISLGISVLQDRFGVWSISLCGFSFGPRVILENVRITLHNVYTFIDISNQKILNFKPRPFFGLCEVNLKLKMRTTILLMLNLQ